MAANKIPVVIKWMRKEFPLDDITQFPTVGDLKLKLQELTEVNPSRQKLLNLSHNGKPATDSCALTELKLKPGFKIMMMGTKEEDIVAAPTEPVKFVEDMNETEIATALDLPVGLANLGNTCYMNATVQCLKCVPPLADALKLFKGNTVSSDTSVSLCSSLRDLYNTMDKKLSIPPVLLLQALHSAFPRFAERAENGVLAQQDASECWTELVRTLQQKLPADDPKYNSVVDEYFGGRLAVEWKCNEAPDEPTTTSQEDFLQLSCFIESDTRYMHSGLKSKLEEVVTKNSPSLSRDAAYTKVSKIDRLPSYLTVQMVRFYFKERGGVNAKVLKDVKFPLVFDAFDLCTKQLQDKLLPMRSKFKEVSDAEAESKGDTSKDKKEQKKVNLPYSFSDDKGSNNSGFYELQAVLTHKGRSSNSGHYLAWIKQKEDFWLKCDDDEVSGVTSEEILKLSGGGDWHVAYVLLYGPKILRIPANEQDESIASEVAEKTTSGDEKMSTD